MPRMRSTTRRTFIGVMRTYRAVARAARRSSATAVPCAISRYPSVPRCCLCDQPRRLRRSSRMWPRNVRVGANSPSLCPTMPSVMNTGTCLRPSCTAIVCPSMSGMIVERRDQVRMTFLVLRSFCASTFLSRWSSTNGPFFRLRGICQPLLALLAGTPAADDKLVAGLVHPAGAAFRLAARVDRVPAARGLALAAAVRVVDRVHGHAAHRRALALPAHPAGLAPVDVGLLGVADLADGGAAAHVDVADLPGGHPQLRVRPVLGDQLDAGAGRAGDLGAATGLQLDRVHHGAGRDVAQRQVVAGLDVGPGA